MTKGKSPNTNLAGGLKNESRGGRGLKGENKNVQLVFSKYDGTCTMKLKYTENYAIEFSKINRLLQEEKLQK